MHLEAADLDPLGRALGSGVRTATRLSGGHSTANWRLDLATGEAVVARRYRPERNACAVEAALLERLAGSVPVPQVVLADPDGAVTGAPLLVTTFVEGRAAAQVLAEDGAGIEAVSRAAGTTLAAIGAPTFASAGFFTADLAVAPMPAGASGLVAFVGEQLDRAVSVEPGLRAAWLRLVERGASVVDAVPPGRSLVHADYNPKNLLVVPDGDGWRVSAVLDWEFAYVGHPAADLGNWLRFADVRGPAYADGFRDGYLAAGGRLPPEWPQLARALDALALAEFLARGPSDAYFGRALALVRRAVERGAL